MGVYTALNLFGCAPWFAALCTINKDNPFENLTYVALTVWFVAVLLLTLNYTIYRVLEGYLPPFSWITRSCPAEWCTSDSRRGLLLSP